MSSIHRELCLNVCVLSLQSRYGCEMKRLKGGFHEMANINEQADYTFSGQPNNKSMEFLTKKLNISNIFLRPIRGLFSP